MNPASLTILIERDRKREREREQNDVIRRSHAVNAVTDWLYGMRRPDSSEEAEGDRAMLMRRVNDTLRLTVLLTTFVCTRKRTVVTDWMLPPMHWHGTMMHWNWMRNDCKHGWSSAIW